MAHNILILEQSDIIQATDWVRQLYIQYNGQSDVVETTSTYGGSPINRMKWVQARYLMPAWVGKTIDAFHIQCYDGVISYEFVRGDVPFTHRVKLDADYKARMEKFFKFK